MEFYLIHMQNIRSSKGTVPVNRPVPEWIFSRSRSLEEAKFEDLVELEPERFDYLFFGISGLLFSKNRKSVPKEKRQPCHQTSYLTFWGTDVLFQWACFCSSGRSIFIVETSFKERKRALSVSPFHTDTHATLCKRVQNMRALHVTLQSEPSVRATNKMVKVRMIN